MGFATVFVFKFIMQQKNHLTQTNQQYTQQPEYKYVSFKVIEYAQRLSVNMFIDKAWRINTFSQLYHMFEQSAV